MISTKPFFKYLRGKQISDKKAADITGVSYATILKMHKENTFNTTILDKLCKGFGIGIENVIRYEPD